MKELMILKSAATESVPALKRAAEQVQRVFPEFKIRGSALEKSPATDLFESTSLMKKGDRYHAVEKEYINMETGCLDSKILASKGSHKISEFDSSGRVVSELKSSPDVGISEGKMFQYDKSGFLEEENKFTTFTKTKTTNQYDKEGRKLETITRNGKVETKRYVTPEGFSVENKYETRKHLDAGRIIDTENILTKEYRDKSGRLLGYRRNIDGKPNSYVEFNPESGNITKFQLGGLLNDSKLEVEYFAPGAFKSINLNSGSNTLFARFEAPYRLAEAKGSVVEDIKQCYAKERLVRDSLASRCSENEYISIQLDKFLPEVVDGKLKGHNLLYGYLDDSILSSGGIKPHSPYIF